MNVASWAGIGWAGQVYAGMGWAVLGWAGFNDVSWAGGDRLGWADLRWDGLGSAVPDWFQRCEVLAGLDAPTDC